MLSQTEAVEFLTNVLEMENIAELLKHEDKHYVLDTIMDSYRKHQPYNNISSPALCLDLRDRHRPSWSEIKEAIFSKLGGMCYVHQLFVFALLKAIGYDISLGRAECGVARHLPHPLLFIRNLNTDDDWYLLESNLPMPSFQLISLDFKNESEVYMDSFLEYKYIKHEKKIMRMHRKGDLSTEFDKVLVLDGWTWYYDFDVPAFETQDVRKFDKQFDEAFTDPHASPYHINLHFVIHKDRKSFIIHNYSFLCETEDGKIEMKTIKSDEELVKTITELTPSFKDVDILTAIHNYKATRSAMSGHGTGKISKPRSYILDYNNVTVTATGTSFYNQCLPSNTVDLALSFSAHHWLSRRIVNPDSIFPQFTNLIQAKNETKEYAKNDLIKFIQQREKELKPGGWGYFSTFGLPCDTSESAASLQHSLLTETFEVLLQNNIVTREEISNTTISVYVRTADEFRQPFTDASDTNLQLKELATFHCPCIFKFRLRNGMCDRKGFDQDLTNQMRVIGYSSIFNGLDKRRSDAEKTDICEKFFQYFEIQLNAKNLDEISSDFAFHNTTVYKPR